MYPSIEPYHGGSIRIYNIYRVCSEFYNVEFLAESFTLRALFKPYYAIASPTYSEYVHTDLLSLGSYAVTRLLRVPQLWQSHIYRLTIPRWTRRASRSAAIIVVEQPWQFVWATRNRGPATAVVYDAHNVEGRMFDARRIRGPRIFADALARLVKSEEKTAVQFADRVFATCPQDAQIMIEDYGVSPERVSIVPNGVDCAATRPVSAIERERAKSALTLSGKHVVLFVGSKYAPNRTAVEYILAWADVEIDTNLHFLIVGSVGSWFTGVSPPNVTFSGYVADVRQFNAAADVAVNPMSSGGGTNLKQIEYLAAGIPSVTTPIGARGLGVRDNVDCLIRDLADIPAAVAMLRDNPLVALQIASAGRKTAESRFDWRVIGGHVVDEFRTTIERKAASAGDGLGRPPTPGFWRRLWARTRTPKAETS